MKNQFLKLNFINSVSSMDEEFEGGADLSEKADSDSEVGNSACLFCRILCC